MGTTFVFFLLSGTSLHHYELSKMIAALQCHQPVPSAPLDPSPLVPQNYVHPSGLSHIPNSVFLCCGYNFTPPSLLGSSEMWKTIGQALSNLNQKRLQVHQHFACSLSQASLPAELWSHIHLAFLLLLMAPAETFLGVLHFPCWLQLQLNFAHACRNGIYNVLCLYVPSKLPAPASTFSILLFLCLSLVKSSLFIHTSLLLCLTSAYWTEPFLCSEKNVLEDHPAPLGPFALQGCFPWDLPKQVPEQAQVCSSEIWDCNSVYLAHSSLNLQLHSLMTTAAMACPWPLHLPPVLSCLRVACPAEHLSKSVHQSIAPRHLSSVLSRNLRGCLCPAIGPSSRYRDG